MPYPNSEQGRQIGILRTDVILKQIAIYYIGTGGMTFGEYIIDGDVHSPTTTP